MEQNTISTQAEVLETTPQLASFQVLFGQAWQFFVKHLFALSSFFFLLTFIPSLLDVLLSAVGYTLLPNVQSRFVFLLISAGISLLGLIFVFVIKLISLGAIKKVQDIAQGIEDSDVVSSKKILLSAWPLFLVWIIAIVVTLGGAFLLIVPGIMVALSTMFVATFVVLENKKPIDAFVASFWLVNNRRWSLLLRYLLLGLLFLGSGLVLLVGLATITIIILHFWFGGVDQGITTVTSLILTNSLGHSGVYYLFSLVWGSLVSLIMTPFLALFVVFHFFVWQNLKTLVTDSASVEFAQKTKKILKTLSVVAIVFTVAFVIIGFVVEESRQERIENGQLLKTVHAGK
jgi:hypothetical protein